ncbi:MAG: ankyrin repeat domain-containing protein [Planctomycetes bacterium]|nr:ankyrin repeat domain-containing protein [Planctomycetota bacterium]
MPTVAIIGGTGPEGRGLGLRLAMGGYPVIIGSREASRGADAAAALLDAGANPNLTSMSDNTPLHMVVSRRSFWEWSETKDDSKRDYLGTARILLERGAKVEAKAEQGKTALHLAASYGDLQLVKFLIAAGASVHARTASRATPLHLAASGLSLWGNDLQPTRSPTRYGDIAKYLLEQGADVNASDDIESTPLYLAAVFCDQSVAAVLLDNGADITATCHHGETPLAGAKRGLRDTHSMASYMPADELAASTQCHKELIQWLERRGAKN